MQEAKDRFLLTMRARLQALNPERTVMVDGIRRPAVLAAENERVEIAHKTPEAFWLTWGEVAQPAGERNALRSLACSVRYFSSGTDELNGIDRGRRLMAMDEEVRQMLQVPEARVVAADGSVGGLQDPGALFWRLKSWNGAEENSNGLQREVQVNVYFFARRVV